MLPFFTTPLAFLGLLTLPALAAVYLLHTRSRPYAVSSLLLWTDTRISPDGGRRVDRLRLPLLFWLELLLLLLLVLAASGPHIPSSAGGRPLVVVLDDSFSMLAGESDTPRSQAAKALHDELRRMPRNSVRLILAGERPQLLGESSRPSDEVESMLDGWTNQAPTARIDAAVSLAFELGGDMSTVLVLTDHAPPEPAPTVGRLRWWAFGTPRPNGAFVNASRSPGPRGDRVLFEVANLAKESRATTLRVHAGDPAVELHATPLNLGAGDSKRVVLELPESTSSSIVRAVIDPDELRYDNAVSLSRTTSRQVNYDLRLGNKQIRECVERALKATGTAIQAESQPQIVFLEGDMRAPEGEEAWIVRLLVEPGAEAFTGPFVLDRSHPLTDGLSLTGAVWGGAKTPLTGAPIVMAGNVPLLTDTEFLSGRHEIQLRLQPDLSTLTDAPGWPALMWNLVQWRASQLPGLDRSNVRLGEEVTWTLANATENVEVKPPAGDTMKVPVRGRRAVVRADRPGVYSLKAGEETATFSANAMIRDESDLTGCVTGRWGDDRDEVTLRLEYRNITWIVVLLAAAVATLHLWMTSRTRPPGGTP